MKLQNILGTVILLTLAGALVSCSNPESDFKKAEQADTEQAYESFIKKHADSPLVVQAKTKIEQNAYEAARRTASIPAYEEFLKRFAAGEHAAEAKAELEVLEFTAASTTPTSVAWKAFLSKYPYSPKASIARNALAEVLLPGIIATNEILIYEAFAKEFSGTRSAGVARERVVALEYGLATNANSIPAYEAFLLKHPEGALSTEAKNRLGAQLEDRDWNQALLQNSEQAYCAFAVKHPAFRNAEVKQGSFSVVMSSPDDSNFVGPNSIVARVSLVGTNRWSCSISVEEALQWGILLKGVPRGMEALGLGSESVYVPEHGVQGSLVVKPAPGDLVPKRSRTVVFANLKPIVK